MPLSDNMPIDDFIYFFYEIDAEDFELCYEELGKEGFKESLENNELALYLKRGKRKVHKVSSSLKLHIFAFPMFMNFFQLMNVIWKIFNIFIKSDYLLQQRYFNHFHVTLKWIFE